MVDDDPTEALEIVRFLWEVSRAFDLGEPIEIDERHDAHAVSREIVIADREPPWDIVLADVMMPPRVGSRPTVGDGAFHIARTLVEKYGPNVPIKLAAVTEYPGRGALSRPLEIYDRPEHANWFWFFPKGNLSEDNVKDRMSFRQWELALVQLISLRNSTRWGLWPLRRGLNPVTPKEVEMANAVFRSPLSVAAITRAAMLGESLQPVVAIDGESGTGKEVVARVLHYHRSTQLNANAPFVVESCASLQLGMYKSTLFGHKKGAFTGAVRDHQGSLERAAHGTLFLDEFGKGAQEVQKALLRVVEDRWIPKLGAQEPVKFEGNLVIVASSEPMTPESGIYSPDFLYRTKRITMPALRDRPEDIVPAARMLLTHNASGIEIGLTKSAEEWLLDDKLTWPANFRDLQELMFEASQDWRRKRIDADDLKRAEEEMLRLNRLLRGVRPTSVRSMVRIETDEDWRAAEAQFPQAGSIADLAGLTGIPETTLGQRIRKHRWKPWWPSPESPRRRRQRRS